MGVLGEVSGGLTGLSGWLWLSGGASLPGYTLSGSPFGSVPSLSETKPSSRGRSGERGKRGVLFDEVMQSGVKKYTWCGEREG